MAGITDIFSSVPQPVQWTLAGIGALTIASRVLSYVHLLLELFILSGTNVSRTFSTMPTGVFLTSAFCSSENMGPRAPGR